MELGLAGRHCFVTGASAGIGRATALSLAAEGALLSIAGRDEGALAATRDTIAAKGASVLRVISCDLSQPAGIEAAATAIAQAQRPVEVLINNAGGGCPYNLDALAAVQTPTRTTQWRLINDDWKLLVPSRRLRG